MTENLSKPTESAQVMSQTPVIHCPGCNKKYRWQEKFAGRKVRCSCGAEMSMPETALGATAAARVPAGAASNHEDYDLDLKDFKLPSGVAAVHGQKCPDCNMEMKEGAVLCMNCGYHLREGKRMEVAVNAPPTKQPDEPSEADQTTPAFRSMLERAERETASREKYAAEIEQAAYFKEKKMPLILVGVGMFMQVFNVFIVLDPAPFASIGGVSSIAVRLYFLILAVLSVGTLVPFLFFAIIFTAWLMKTAFGSVFTAMVKLIALSLFILAIADGADFLAWRLTDGMIGFPWIAKICIMAGIFVLMAVWLFDEIDITEAMIVFVVGFLSSWAFKLFVVLPTVLNFLGLI